MSSSLPQGATTERTFDTSRMETRPALLLQGVLPGDATGVRLDAGTVRLGRASDSTLVLDRRGVSRHHAEIYRQGPVFSIRDLGSTNGTYVDGRRVEHAGAAAGALLRVGDWLGAFELADPAEPAVEFHELRPGLFGASRLERLLGDVESAARAGLPVVLLGETGTGKELFARAVHACAERSGPFRTVNCATLSGELAEAELFGHAQSEQPGVTAAVTGASNGTLFLKNASELPLPLQAKLLRALELGEAVPLGAKLPVPFTPQLVLSCQRPLDAAVRDGAFRADLAARVAGARVNLPLLRDRRSEIPKLFHESLRRQAAAGAVAVSTKAYECLALYPWPGNLRELDLLARRLAPRLSSEPLLRRRHLPEEIRSVVEPEAAAPDAPEVTRHRQDAERLALALKESSGNVTRAAKAIGISRQRAYRLLRG